MNNKVSSLLFDEPAEMTKIYNYLIANMDYSTCITGIKRRVSYQAFKELLDVPATKGRVSVPSSRAKARAYLKRMDAIGLINDQGDCVYKLAYETPHKTDATRFPRGTHEVIASPASNTNGSGGKFPRSNPEVPTHLTTTTTTTGFFQMFTDWEPLESFANDAKRAGYDIAGKDEALFNCALVDVK